MATRHAPPAIWPSKTSLCRPRLDIADSVEQFMADMEAEIERQRERYGLIFDADLARQFAAESSDTYRS